VCAAAFYFLLLECECFAAALVYLPLKYWLVSVASCLLWVWPFLLCCGVTWYSSFLLWSGWVVQPLYCRAALYYCDLAEWCSPFLLWGWLLLQHLLLWSDCWYGLSSMCVAGNYGLFSSTVVWLVQPLSSLLCEVSVGAALLFTAMVWLWVPLSLLLWGICCPVQTVTSLFGLWPSLVRVLSPEVLCEGLCSLPTVCVRVWLCEVFVTLSPWWQESSSSLGKRSNLYGGSMS